MTNSGNQDQTAGTTSTPRNLRLSPNLALTSSGPLAGVTRFTSTTLGANAPIRDKDPEVGTTIPAFEGIAPEWKSSDFMTQDYETLEEAQGGQNRTCAIIGKSASMTIANTRSEGQG